MWWQESVKTVQIRDPIQKDLNLMGVTGQQEPKEVQYKCQVLNLGWK